jgi:hypothetical protein
MLGKIPEMLASLATAGGPQQIDASDLKLPDLERQHRGRELQQGGLPGSIRAQQTSESLPEWERHRLKRQLTSVTMAHVSEGNPEGIGHSAHSCGGTGLTKPAG